MADHAWDLLRAGKLLLLTDEHNLCPPDEAAVRRSISTSYYAMFHFILGECAAEVVGSGDRLARRRNIFLRSISHRGLKLAMAKVSGASPAQDVAEFLRSATSVDPLVGTPSFAHEFAGIFLDAFQKRQLADYDLNAKFGLEDAILMAINAEAAMTGWTAAGSVGDDDFKAAFALLIALQGRLRTDNE